MVTLTAVLLFVNPNGGKKKGAELGRRAVAAFEANSVQVTVIETTHARHAEEYLRDTAKSKFEAFQAVIGIGGDGTMSEIINGLMARKDGLRIPLGLLAGGTGNSFMGDLQEWENLGGYDNEKLLDTVEDTVTAWCLGAHLHSLDLGKVTFGDGSVRYSFNCVLMGLGVEANVYAEQVRFLGPARYDVGALGAIAMNRHRKYLVTIDGSTVEYPASIVGIYGTQSASFRMVPGAKVDDGLLDFSGLSPMPRGELLHVFDEMKRDGSHVYEAGVVHHRGKRIEIVSGDGAELVNVDGENCGCAPLVCEVQPGAVQFLAAGACMR
jgi:diacylglycerol kinase family enzyme